MTVGFNTLYPKSVSLNFTIKNISSLRKTINVFGSKIEYNESLDLMAIPEVSEADIRHSLIKGELYKKIINNDIRLESSSIDLSQFDYEQRQFLINAGLTSGVFGSTPSSITWDPDGSGDATTWQEVMQYIDASNCPVNIYCKKSATIPSGFYDLKLSKFIGKNIGDPGNIIINMEDGAILYNLFGVSISMVLVGNPTTGPCLTFDTEITGPRSIVAEFGGIITNMGTTAMIEVADNSFFILASLNSGSFNATGFNNYPLLNLGSAATCLIVAYNGVSGDNPISGPSDALIFFAHDGTLPFFPPDPFVDFDGTLLNSPSTGCGSGGPSMYRPVATISPIVLGCKYFDTDLSPPKPIFWDGSGWVDALGVSV